MGLATDGGSPTPAAVIGLDHYLHEQKVSMSLYSQTRRKAATRSQVEGQNILNAPAQHPPSAPAETQDPSQRDEETGDRRP